MSALVLPSMTDKFADEDRELVADLNLSAGMPREVRESLFARFEGLPSRILLGLLDSP